MRNVRFAVVVVVLSTLAVACGPGTATTTSDDPAATTTPPGTTGPPTTISNAEPSTTSTSAPIFQDPGTLLVVGDWGSGTLPQGAVAGAMSRFAEDNEVSAILTTGDNFYLDDWEFLMEPFGWATTSGIPFWVTWGNHDVESETRIDAVNTAFDEPPRWAVYQWGLVDVIVLDSNQITSPAQALFFLNAMGESGRPAIVVMHHPPYSCSQHGATIEVVNQVVDLLDNDVFLVLSGHDHSYQRFENDDITYVVTGGGGRTLYPLGDCPSNHPELLAGAEIHHFLVLRQREGSLDLIALDVNNEVVDQVSIEFPDS